MNSRCSGARTAALSPGGPRAVFAACLATLLVLGSAGLRAEATVVIPIPDEALAAHAAAIVVGQVTAIESRWDQRHRQIFSLITLSVDEVLKGNLAPGELTLKQVGGSIGTFHSWTEGSPELFVDEKVLLFLRQNPDGSFRVAHLYQGKFSILGDPFTGAEYAYRVAPEGVHVIAADSTPVPAYDLHAFQSFKTRIRRHARAAPGDPGTKAPVIKPEVASVVSQPSRQFAFIGSPSRWFEPDAALPVKVSINSLGEPAAPTGGMEQARAAMAAWSSVTGSSFRYNDGGLTPAQGYKYDGVSTVSFRDPLGQMDAPVRCGGTLAIGGFFRSGSQTRTVNGQSFYRIFEADVVVNDQWNGCRFYEDFPKLAEVLTHELGHALGLGHSSDPGATMYAFAHFDGRGASLAEADIAGLRFAYPSADPPTPADLALLSVTAPATARSTGTSAP